MTTTSEKLKKIYYDPSHPYSYGSVAKLYKAASSQIPNLTVDQVKDWLSGENTYTLHRQARRNFGREKILVSSPNEQFQADLVDMQAFSRFNSGFKYILTVIDCFTRVAYAIPVKNKTGLEIKNALEKVFKNRRPHILQTDRGKEFLNKPVQDYLKENEISFFTTFNTTFKCAIVERFNRTLKSKMFKYFSSKGTKRYIDVLDKLIQSYNNCYHRSIKTFPLNVNNSNKLGVFKNIYGYKNEREYIMSQNIQPKLKSGDLVRRKYELTPMDKGYYPNWTDVIYTIDKPIKGNQQPMYSLKTIDGSTLSRKYYPEEVQKIKENLYRIEKIIKPQNQNGVEGYIVKWLGYSPHHNSWVPKDQITNAATLN